MDVIDGDEDPPILRERPERVQESDRDCSRVGRRTCGLFTQERHPHGPLLGDWQAGENFLVDRLEQVTEARIGEGRLHVGRARQEDSPRSSRRHFEPGEPEDRLADPGLTLDQQHPRAVRGIGEEGIDLRELGPSADDGLSHATHVLVQPSRLRRLGDYRPPSTRSASGRAVCRISNPKAKFVETHVSAIAAPS